mmetsp:Transcript_6871/g.14451  ORF Transcript_6871/g.14451 Transcript_6871/m.14451 type:complete len:398 (+) Transcript_6871:582-1775(+)
MFGGVRGRSNGGGDGRFGFEYVDVRFEFVGGEFERREGEERNSPPRNLPLPPGSANPRTHPTPPLHVPPLLLRPNLPNRSRQLGHRRPFLPQRRHAQTLEGAVLRSAFGVLLLRIRVQSAFGVDVGPKGRVDSERVFAGGGIRIRGLLLAGDVAEGGFEGGGAGEEGGRGGGNRRRRQLQRRRRRKRGGEGTKNSESSVATPQGTFHPQSQSTLPSPFGPGVLLRNFRIGRSKSPPLLRGGSIGLRFEGCGCHVSDNRTFGHSHTGSAVETFERMSGGKDGDRRGVHVRGGEQRLLRPGQVQGMHLRRGGLRRIHDDVVPYHIGHQIEQRGRARTGTHPGRPLLPLVPRLRPGTRYAPFRLSSDQGSTVPRSRGHVSVRRIVVPGGGGMRVSVAEGS